MPSPAFEVARRIWGTSIGDADEASDVATAATLLFTRLDDGLGRWIGAIGYRGVLDRALGQVRATHAWTRDLDSGANHDSVVRAAVAAVGEADTIEGIVALLTAIIELLGRIVGDVVASRLVEQAGAPALREVAGSKLEQDTHD